MQETLMQNRKALLGGEFILWFFRLLLLIIIFVGIVVIVNSFYSRQYDAREIEANLLADRFAECLMKDGAISKNDIANVFDSCNLKLDLDENYVNITLSGKEITSNSLGDDSLEVWCETKRIVRQRFPSSCLTKSYLVLEKSEDGTLILSTLKILVAILKIEKNV